MKDYGTCCTYADGLVITAESEEEAVRKFGVWKREMETRGLKVNINKTKLMVIGREKWGLWPRKLEQTQYAVNVLKGGTTRDVQGSDDKR